MEANIKYITNKSEFDETIQNLSKKKQIFIDLEFDKNHFRYGFNLCLMQIFDGDSTCYLIDPVLNIDIKNIFPILENDKIQLVCYAFNEDMRLLHHIGAHPNNILDLAVVSRLLNYEALSLNNALATVLEEEHFTTQKSSQQKSNWCLRPLKEQQKEYAMKDVVYLPVLQNKLEREIHKMGREKWVEQEMNAFENFDWTDGSVANYLTNKDKKQCTLQEWIRFKKLMKHREKIGKSLNRPTYKVLNKKIIFALAKSPKLVDKSNTFKGMHPKIKLNEIQSTFKTLLEEAEKEIKKKSVSIDASSRTPLSKEEKLLLKRQKKRVQSITDTFFLPVKKEMKKAYGESFSNYFLSNRKIKEYAIGKQKLLPYQKELIIQIANQIKAPLPQFITTQ